MTRDELISKLHDARALVYQAHEGTDMPQIQMILRHADQNLHWALWNLGVVNSLKPDLPEERPVRVKPARPAAKKRAAAKAKAKPKRRTTATKKKRAPARKRAKRH